MGAHHTTVGGGAGLSSATSPTGGFAAAVPLDLPASRDGIPVPLQIQYGASTRVGAAGSGWDIPLSYVRVSTSTMRRKPSVENDGSLLSFVPPRVFVALGGSPTLMVPGDKKVYLPFAADSYMELERMGDRWELHTLDGLDYVFSPVSSLGGGLLDDPGLWLLTEIRNHFSADRVELEYDVADADCYADTHGPGVNLAAVRHTFDASDHPLYEVRLTYNTWSTQTGALGGPCQQLSTSVDEDHWTVRSNIVERVEVLAANNLAASSELKRIRSYELTYGPDEDTALPRLLAVDVSGEPGVSGPSSLPMARYEYGAAGSYVKGTVVPRSFIGPDGDDHVDEYADSLSSSEVVTEEFALDPDPNFGPPLPVGAPLTATLEHVFTRHVIRDFTGDGLPDLVFKTGDTWVLYRNRTTDEGTRLDFSTPYTWTEPAEIFEQTTFQFTGSVAMRYEGARKTALTTETWVQFMDWNGDGRMDVVDARGGDEKHSWKVWVNEGLANGQVVWRAENVFIDELRPAGTDPDFPFRDLQSQVDDVVDGLRFLYVGEIDLHAEGRFPLERSRSWARVYTDRCEGEWTNPPAGHAVGDPEPCPVPLEVVQAETDTLIEWRVTDANGDGYPDFMTNLQPVQACEQVGGGTYFDGAVTYTHNQHWRFLNYGVCPHPNVDGPTPPVDPRYEVFLNIGGSLFPAFAHEGEVFRSTGTRPSERSGIGHWVNGEASWSMRPGFEPPLGWSLDPGPAVEARGFGDSDGDGVPQVELDSARFDSDRWEVCVPGAPANQTYYSRQTEGLVDLNGDGIPDRVSFEVAGAFLIGEWSVRYGTGRGYGPAQAIQDQSGSFEISLTEGTCGGTSRTIAGLLDIDGDGVPEVVAIDNGELRASRQKLKHPSAAGRLVAVDNGYGAVTRIEYGNNKADVTTPHEVPFPEIVVKEVHVEATGTPGTIPTRYAYGTARLRYDPLLARWGFPGYQRTVALTGDPLDHGPDFPFTEGLAIITDRAPSAPAGAGYAAFVLSGRTYRTTKLEGSFGTNPSELLGVDVETDSRARAGVTIEHDTVELPGNPVGSEGEECFDADGASGTYPLEDYALCRRAGLIVASSSTQWEGAAAPPSTSNVLSGSYVEDYDALGRPTRTVSLGDLRRTDDDTCNYIQYAVSVSQRKLTAPSAVWTSDCGWGRPQPQPGGPPIAGAPLIIAGVRFAYDNLPEGAVDAGRVTARIVERYDGDGNLLDQHVAERNYFNDMSLPVRVVRDRALGTAATQITEFDYDRYGATITRTRATASDVDVELVRHTVYPTWPSERVEVISPTGESYRTYRDSMGRPIQDTLTPVGGVEYVQNQSRYNDSVAGRDVTTTVHLGSTLADTSDATATRTRTARTFLDAMGRARCTEESLGGDYGNKVLVTRWTRYDDWGRARFVASPFERAAGGAPCAVAPGGPYGTTHVYDRGGRKVRSVDGPGLQLEAVQTNPALDVYPTSYQYAWRDGLSIMKVQGPTEAQAGSPTAGGWDEVRVTASGRAIDSSRWKSSSVRIDYVERTYDRLGRVAATRRYRKPETTAGPVEWSQKFDSLGQVLEQREPGAAPILTRYDEWGAPLESEWLDGSYRRLTRMAYDGFGRLTERHLLQVKQGETTEFPEATEFFHYDAHSGDPDQPIGEGTFAGRLSWSETVGTAAEFTSYDAFGRPQTSTVVHADEGRPFRTRTRYSASGVVDAIGYEYPDTTEEVSYAYDSAGRMRQVQYSDGATSTPLIANTDIDALGRYRMMLLGNGVKESFDFQPTGRQELSAWTVNTASDLRSTTYDEFDPEMRIKKLGERTTSPGNPSEPYSYSTYTYDDLDRLIATVTTRLTTTTAQHSYRYNALGNHTQLRDHLDNSALLNVYYQSADPDKLDRTAGPSFGGSIWQFAYDGAGNVVTHKRVAGSSTLADRFFTYDSGSRIIKMSRGQRAATFSYSPGGGLLKEEVHDGVTLDRRIRHYGGAFQQRTLPSGQSVVERYVTGPLGVIATIRGEGANRSIVYAHGDGRANKLFTREDGTVVQSADYQPYGKIRAQTGTPASQDYTDNLFNGGDTYSDFGIVVLGARIYDPELGRFLQRDPIVYVPRSTSANPYTFSFADPINYTDSNGLYPYVWIGTSSGAPSVGSGSWSGGSDWGMGLLATVLTMALTSDFSGIDAGRWGSYGTATGLQTGGAGKLLPAIPLTGAEVSAEFAIGALDSVFGMARETVYNVYDMGGLGLSVLGQETGWFSYEHDTVSAVAAASKQGATTGGLLWGMATAPLTALEGLAEGVIEGDPRKMGENAMGAYAAFAGARAVIAATGGAAAGLANFVRNPWGRKGSPAHRGRVAQAEASLNGKGYPTISGGAMLPEAMAKAPGVRPRFPDLVVKGPNGPVAIQVGRATKSGKPVARERRAIADLRATNLFSHVFFLRY